jgi:hypothetical protein
LASRRTRLTSGRTLRRTVLLRDCLSADGEQECCRGESDKDTLHGLPPMRPQRGNHRTSRGLCFEIAAKSSCVRDVGWRLWRPNDGDAGENKYKSLSRSLISGHVIGVLFRRHSTLQHDARRM